jgi:hypothetical protein
MISNLKFEGDYAHPEDERQALSTDWSADSTDQVAKTLLACQPNPIRYTCLLWHGCDQGGQ